MTIDYNFLLTPVGLVLMASEQNRLCWLSVGAEEEKLELLQALQHQYVNAALQHNNNANSAYTEALHSYFSGSDLALNLPLEPKGTPWQQQVWQELQQIPAGTSISYSELAQRCAKPQAVRAVASACAKNPIALFIPCHRVVAKSGALSGYRWGIEKKQWLLNWEQSEC